MIDAFAGLDRHIPRPVRAELVGWQNQGLITLSRVVLPDVPAEADLLADPQMRWAIDGRWNADSPLRRAALAGLAYRRGRGAGLDDIDLVGRRLPTLRRMAGHRSEARWWVNWKWQGYTSIPYCVTSADGWMEVVQPTRTRPLNALLIQPGPRAATFRC